MALHNKSLERRMLSALLDYDHLRSDYFSRLNPNDFHYKENRRIFNFFQRLYDNDELDRETAFNRVESQDEDVLTDVYTEGVVQEEVDSIYKNIKDLSGRRGVRQIAQKALEGIKSEEDLESIIASLEGGAKDVARSSIDSDSLVSTADYAQEFMDYLDKINSSDQMGIETPVEKLTDLTNGFRDSKMITLAARPSVGKCIAKDQKVVDPETGNYLEVEEFIESNKNEVLSLQENYQIQSEEVTSTLDDGKKPVFEVETQTGRKIKTTLSHPFLTVNGWKSLSELDKGENVAVPRKIDVEGSKTMSPERARLLGYLIAEGGLTHSSPRFHNGDNAVIEDFEQCLAKEFPEYSLTQLESETGVDYSISRSGGPGGNKSPNAVKEWLESLDLANHKSKDKAIPGVVFRLDNSSLAQFLQALFTGDGYIAREKAKNRVSLAMASREIVEDVHHLLLRLGIISLMEHKEVQLNDDTFDAWRIQISDYHNIKKFSDRIGFIGDKQARVVDEPDNKRKSNYDHVPSDVWKTIDEKRNEKNMSIASMERTRRGLPEDVRGLNPHRFTRDVGRERLEGYADVLDSSELHNLANSDVLWDTVESIEYAGHEQVYDLTIDSTHNFVAQDFIVHNTDLSLQFALHAASNGNDVGFFSLEMDMPTVVLRLVANLLGVPRDILKEGNWGKELQGYIANVMAKLTKEMPIKIDTATKAISSINYKIQRKAKQGELDIALIDYFGLLEVKRRQQGWNQQNFYRQLSKKIKEIAKEAEVPVVLVSQLNREVEKREDKVPRMADLRNTGGLEQDSDLVMFLYRENYYDKRDNDKPDPGPVDDNAIIKLAKQRNGPTGMVVTRYDEATGRWGQAHDYQGPVRKNMIPDDTHGPGDGKQKVSEMGEEDEGNVGF